MTEIRPLRVVLGEDWRAQDMLRLTDPDVSCRLMIEPTKAEKQIMTQAINAVVRAMHKRYPVRGLYTLAQAEQFYRAGPIPLVGERGREMLDALFGEPPQQAASTTYTYPVLTMSGVAYAPMRPVEWGCRGCAWYAECHAQVVERDGFALCEDILPSEVLREGWRV